LPPSAYRADDYRSNFGNWRFSVISAYTASPSLALISSVPAEGRTSFFKLQIAKDNMTLLSRCIRRIPLIALLLVTAVCALGQSFQSTSDTVEVGEKKALPIDPYYGMPQGCSLKSAAPTIVKVPSDEKAMEGIAVGQANIQMVCGGAVKATLPVKVTAPTVDTNIKSHYDVQSSSVGAWMISVHCSHGTGRATSSNPSVLHLSSDSQQLYPTSDGTTTINLYCSNLKIKDMVVAVGSAKTPPPPTGELTPSALSVTVNGKEAFKAHCSEVKPLLIVGDPSLIAITERPANGPGLFGALKGFFATDGEVEGKAPGKTKLSLSCKGTIFATIPVTVVPQIGRGIPPHPSIECKKNEHIDPKSNKCVPN
jgi:hypothetical protein